MRIYRLTGLREHWLVFGKPKELTGKALEAEMLSAELQGRC